MKCKKCAYYDIKTNSCKDKENFVDKNNYKLIVCRFNKNSIPFRKIYNVDKNRK
jgi:hypothetical protein